MLKVGDKVKIIGEELFWEPKSFYGNKVATITKVFGSSYPLQYKLDVDDGAFYWRDNELTKDENVTNVTEDFIKMLTFNIRVESLKALREAYARNIELIDKELIKNG